MRVFPTSTQWRGWSLPSKLTAVGAYLAVLGIVLALILAVLPYFRPPSQQQPPEQSLRNEILRNTEILQTKIIVADDLFRRMRLAEQENTPSPYRDLATRLKRDLPRFEFGRLSALEDSPASEKEPFHTYLEAYRLLKALEDLEQTTVLLFHRITDGYYDIRRPGGLAVIDVRGVPFYGRQFQALLGSYAFGHARVRAILANINVKEVAELPSNLYFVTERANESDRTPATP